MKCSVTADPAEAGLTGKHEVREDVNKRKGLLKSSWRLVIITHWHSNGLISPFRTKNDSARLHHLLFCNHNSTLLFLLSYIIHANVQRMVIITCEKVVVPLPAQVWQSEHDLPKSFKGDVFTRKADSKKRQTSEDLSVPASFMCPDVSWLESSRNAPPLVH